MSVALDALVRRLGVDMALTIIPKIQSRSAIYSAPVTAEMVQLAQRRCSVMMRDLVDGKPLTDVLVKAYLQGFFDYHQTIEEDVSDVK